MQIFHPYSQFSHIVCQIFCHAFRQSSDQDFILPCCLFTNLGDQIVDLSFYRSYFYIWIQESRRTDHLLSPQQFMLLFIFTRSRGDEHDLVDLAFKFLKTKRPVVLSRRETEPIIHQRCFSRLIPMIHRSDLRNRLMGLIDDHQKIIREIVDQSLRRLSRCKSR